MPDPFEVLRREVPSIRPRPQFVIELRRRLQEEIDMTPTATTASTLGLVHVRVADADRAMAFFGSVFGWVAERVEFDGHVSHYTQNTAVTIRLLDDPTASPVRPNFHVDDVGAAVRAIEAAGGRVTSSSVEADGGGWAYADDAAGLPILVYRPSGRYHEPHDGAPVSGDLGLVFIVEPEPDAAAFYGPVLGWTFEPEHPGSRYFDTTERVGVFDGPSAPSITWFVDVADLGAAVERVRAAGGTAGDLLAEPDMGPYFTVACTDDQGTAFSLMSLRR
jgi:predicted enzyme related to lactoylglutathione lyase